jgi:hypothetical protein
VLWYPTQAKTGLEWGTQPPLSVKKSEKVTTSERTWAEKNAAQPFHRSYSASKPQLARARALVQGVKALEKCRFRPRYAEANLGHPSRTTDRG